MKKRTANFEYRIGNWAGGVVAAKSKGHAASIIAKLHGANVRGACDGGWLVQTGPQQWQTMAIAFIEYQ